MAARGASACDPVVIVGLGPVGAVAAHLLAARGLSVVVVEREREVFALSRAVALDDEALAVLADCGLDPGRRPPMLTSQTVRFRAADGSVLVELPPRRAPSGLPGLAFFDQPGLERALREGLGARPEVELRLGDEVETLHPDAHGVTLGLHAVESGERSELRASLVLGCDGARSAVRRELGVPLRGLTSRQRWLVVDGRWRDRGRGERPDAFEFHCDPRRPAVSGALPGGRQRWEFMLNPDESARALEHPEVVAGLLGPWAGPDALEVLRATVYVFHARVAARWRVGRVLLLGDAAHLSPPFLGQGLSAGLRDADLLARILPAALAAGGDLEPLDRWARERRREVVALTAVAVLLGGLIQIRNSRAAAVRDRLLRPLLARRRVRAWLAAGRWKPRSGRSPVSGARLSSPGSRTDVSFADDHD